MDSVDAVFTGNTVGMTYSTISNTSFNATNYAWDFGNATFSNLATPSNLYTSPGNYNVMLVASNANCSDTAYFTSFADDALDVFGIHAFGGAVGAVLTGVFATKAIGGVEGGFGFGSDFRVYERGDYGENLQN